MDETTMQDKIERAYSRLSALKKNTPDRFYVDEEHVRQYHEALQHLADLGFDVGEFRIPDRRLEHRVAVAGPRGTQYKKKREAETSKFLSKLDAVLVYFSATTPASSEGAPGRVIGFTPGDK